MSYCVVHGRAKEATFHPWASPIGMERQVNQPCINVSALRWIPVTHCKDPSERRGLYWYYAAIGCSDMFVDIGPKTLIARNRCHAAALLSDTKLWWTRIKFTSDWLSRASRSVPTVYNSTFAAEYIYKDCVRGVFNCNDQNFARIRSKYIAYHRCYISGHDKLSDYIAARMRHYNYSSVQLIQQPEGDRWRMNHEILFLSRPSLRISNEEKCELTQNRGCTSCKNALLIQNITMWRSNSQRFKK